MPDREKVIGHLQIINIWAELARERHLQFFTPKHLNDIAQWSDDAIAMLKEQELVRCKDCRKNMLCKLTIDKPRNWFCADGKRR